MERRYPVMLREFGLREHSGGKGQFHGGDGVVREIEFLENGLQVSILSERRVFQPYGLNGGESGQRGMNILKRKTPQGFRDINFGGKNSTTVAAGDRIQILTPGGGGYGSASLAESGKRKSEGGDAKVFAKKAGGSLQNYLDQQNQN